MKTEQQTTLSRLIRNAFEIATEGEEPELINLARSLGLHNIADEMQMDYETYQFFILNNLNKTTK